MMQINQMVAIPVRDFFTRHQIVSRLIWLGVLQTAVLVVMELSSYLVKRLV